MSDENTQTAATILVMGLYHRVGGFDESSIKLRAQTFLIREGNVYERIFRLVHKPTQSFSRYSIAHSNKSNIPSIKNVRACILREINRYNV